MTEFLTAAFYKFAELDHFQDLRAPLLAVCEANQVVGNILLAQEGVNGTIAGPVAGVRAALDWLRADPRLASLEHKEAWAAKQPFYRMKVRLKREIVTMGRPDVSPTQQAGQYVKPEDWNALLADPNVILVDTRNDYEVAIGTFRGALNPHTSSFTELPDWVEKASGPGAPLAGKPKVAMFCTGGIRCEKSTALLKAQGFDDVYHLEGGILKYLETVPESESIWEGQCFVFDERVSVGHGLTPGDYSLCRSCRYPLSASDRASPLYERGVSCAHCHGTRSDSELQALRERERQMTLAETRQQTHLGAKLASHHKEVPDESEPAHEAAPVLYSFRRCPYAMRARLALAASGQRVELREVVLRHKPEEMLAASPKGTVPVLVLPSGELLEQSLDIMRWALAKNDPHQWLAPTDGTLQQMEQLIAEVDGAFKRHLDRYKYPQRYVDEHAENSPADFATQHRTAASDFLMTQLEARLTATRYLFGAHATLADMAIAPFVRQFARVEPEWFEAQAWPALARWLQQWEASDLLASVMHKLPAWQSGTPGVRFPAR